MPVGAAIGGSAVLGAGASIYSGNRAADAARDGAQQSADVQRYMYDTTRADSAPYRQVGASALNQLASLYGLPQYNEKLERSPDALPPGVTPRPDGRGAFGSGRLRQLAWDHKYGDQVAAYQKEAVDAREAINGEHLPRATPDYSAFMNSPDYQFAFSEGSRGVEQALARQGLTGSGAALKSLTRFGQGLASQQLGNYKNSLAALAGIGQSSTSQLGSLGVATGQGIGAAHRAAGDARGSAYLNQGAAVSNLANTGGQFALLRAGGYI